MIDVAVVAALAVAAATAFFVFLHEPLLSDDLSYFESADKLLGWEPTGRSANAHRFGLIAVAALSRLLFGETMTALYGVPLILNTLALVAVYLFGRLFFPRWVAFGGAAVLLSQPLFLRDFSFLLPDWPAMFWLVGGFSALVVAVRAGPATRRRRVLSALVSGAMFFVAVWTKESTLPMLAAVPLLLWAVDRDSRWRRTVVIAVGAFLVGLVGEVLVSWSLFDDPFSRWSAITSGHLETAASGFTDKGETWTWATLTTRYLGMMAESMAGRLLLLATPIALVITVVTRDRRLVLFGALALFGAVFVSLAVVSLDPLSPLLRTKSRYFSMCLAFLPAFVVGAGWVATDRVRAMDRHFGSLILHWVLVVSLLGVGLGFVGAFHDPTLIRNGSDLIGDTRHVLSGLERSPTLDLDRVFVDNRTIRALRLYLPDSRFKGLVADGRLTVASSGSVPSHSVVVVNLSWLEDLDGLLPVWLTDPPVNWISLASSSSPARGQVWYVLDRDVIDNSSRNVAPSLGVEVDGERVPISQNSSGNHEVTVHGRTRVETLAPTPIEAGTDLTVVRVVVTPTSGSVDVRTARVVVRTSEGEWVDREWLRTVPGSGGSELTGSLVLDPEMADTGYTIIVVLDGRGSVAIEATASHLALGFDDIARD
jgi:hypothetical protein